MDIKVIVATHKKYKMPEDEMYMPLLVGADFNKRVEGYQTDNMGLNISELNPFFCELTGVYWAWKNLNADYIGLVHYRRYFKGKTKSSDKFNNILKLDEAETVLEEVDVILPKKQNYIIENIYSHYSHTHYEKDLKITYDILKEKYPEYLYFWNKQMKSTSAHMFNMFIMKKELFDNYCSFIFAILFELKRRIDISEYDKFQARVFGRISELLLDVWLYKNGYLYKELPVMYMESINWEKKIISFLSAKFFHRKYKGSF